jgi:zinc protease
MTGDMVGTPVYMAPDPENFRGIHAQRVLTGIEDVSLDELEAAFMAEVEKILEEGLSEEDVARSRNSLAAASIYGRDSQSGMANLYGRSLATGATIEDVMSYSDRVKAVTAEEATAALRTVFGPDMNYVNGRLLPEETFQ